MQVSILYTAPTAIRSLMAKGDEPVKKHNRSSLRVLGTVGEPINPEAWRWYYEVSLPSLLRHLFLSSLLVIVVACYRRCLLVSTHRWTRHPAVVNPGLFLLGKASWRSLTFLFLVF